MVKWLKQPPENQFLRASGLNLLVAAAMLWNTKYLEHAMAKLPPQLQVHT
jgi:TnpA family transposase